MSVLCFIFPFFDCLISLLSLENTHETKIFFLNQLRSMLLSRASCTCKFTAWFYLHFFEQSWIEPRMRGCVFLPSVMRFRPFRLEIEEPPDTNSKRS